MNGITSIIFRDYLNNHADERKRYQALKMELYEKFKDNRKEYTHGKDEYIKKIIAIAMEEKN